MALGCCNIDSSEPFFDFTKGDKLHKPKPWKLTEGQRLDVLHRYDNGETIRSISKDLNVSNSPIRYLLKKNNVQIRGASESVVKKNLDRTFFHNIDSEEKAYWVGFLMADAGIQKGCVKLDLSIVDKNHLLCFVNDVGSAYKVTERLCSRGHRQITTTLYSPEIVGDLSVLGVGERKSFTATPPTIDASLVRHMVRGLFDGDGWIWKSKTKPTVQVGLCGSLGTCGFVSEWIFSSFGYKASVAKSGSIYRTVVSARWAAEELLSCLYVESSRSLERKHNKAMEVLSYE